MNVTMTTHERADIGKALEVPYEAKILIVCENGSDTEKLKAVLQKEGFVSESAKTIAEGCEAAKSGRFQVIISAPLLRDGSWKRLTDIANHYDLYFEIILWAHNFDLSEWAKALADGAFDVLDATREQPKAVEATKSALWAAYLKGARPYPTAITPRKVA